MKTRLIPTTSLAAGLLLTACNKPAEHAETACGAAAQPAPAPEPPKPVNADAAQNPELLQEAVTALNETQNALADIDKGDGKAASAALETATGRLEIVLANKPSMALAPVDVGVVRGWE